MTTEPGSRSLRTAEIFVPDLLGALLVPAILRRKGYANIPFHSAGHRGKAWCLDLVVGAFMGFMMYRTWRSNPSKWMWILPSLWFAFGVTLYSGTGTRVVFC